MNERENTFPESQNLYVLETCTMCAQSIRGLVVLYDNFTFVY